MTSKPTTINFCGEGQSTFFYIYILLFFDSQTAPLRETLTTNNALFPPTYNGGSCSFLLQWPIHERLQNPAPVLGKTGRARSVPLNLGGNSLEERALNADQFCNSLNLSKLDGE